MTVSSRPCSQTAAPTAASGASAGSSARSSAAPAIRLESRASQLLSSGSRYHNANALCEGQMLLTEARTRRLKALARLRRFLAERPPPVEAPPPPSVAPPSAPVAEELSADGDAADHGSVEHRSDGAPSGSQPVGAGPRSDT